MAFHLRGTLIGGIVEYRINSPNSYQLAYEKSLNVG
jgi:hypothetical protein